MNSNNDGSSNNSNVDKCTCSKSNSESESSTDSTSPNTNKEKKPKISLTSLGFNLRRGRSLNLNAKRSRKCARHPADGSTASTSAAPAAPTTVKKSPKWVMKFNCTKKEPKLLGTESESYKCCQCTGYRRTEEHHLGAGVVFETEASNQNEQKSEQQSQNVEAAATTAALSATAGCAAAAAAATTSEVVTVSLEETIVIPATSAETSEVATSSSSSEREEGFPNNVVYGSARPANPGPHIIISSPFLNEWLRAVHEDCDEQARIQRAREIAEGVEPPPNFRPVRRLQLLCPEIDQSDGSFAPRRLQLVCPPDLTVDNIRALFQNHVTLRSCPLDSIAGCHTQVDFIHCLVPDLLNITNCSFYWGKMDRYEAERLLDSKPEGTFLLRDSAQEEFLFSVSFRKYGRSLHARIEQWNHKFSFDSHDPGVYTSDTVCGLIEHYKDPSSCMFFEPMLTWPLHRNFTFSLQHLCRSVIVSRLTYDNVGQLELPKTLKSYLKEYHYRQKVRVERFDDDIQWIDLRN